MADTVCPACSTDITPDDINMREGAAYCRACDKMWRLSDLTGPDPSTPTFHASPSTSHDDDLEEATADELASREPPPGCWLRDESPYGDHQTCLGARCRSSTGFFFLFFAAFWNTITWLFVILALTGVMSGPSLPSQPVTSAAPAASAPASPPSPEAPNVEAPSTPAGTPLPNTIPDATPEATPASATADPFRSSSGPDWLILLFMIPFILVGLLTAAFAAVGVFGRCEVTLRSQNGHVFTGVGPPTLRLGWTRRFAADMVRSVNIRNSNSSTNGKPNKHIVIVADNDVSLGLFLAPDRRRWLAGTLRALLIPKR